MQTPFSHSQSLNLGDFPAENAEADFSEDVAVAVEPTSFKAHYQGCMEMYSDAETVSEYLNTHQGWFCRCAHPMGVEPLTENSYVLVVGRFGAFGYDVEPKIAVALLPPENRVYRMQSVPIPDAVPQGYEVDYKAALELTEISTSRKSSLPEVITQVQWTLDLGVCVQFPKFIHKLPRGIIQKTGDRLLSQIIRQVSRRLTHKVQQDFHSRQGLPMPSQKKKHATEDLEISGV